MAAENFTKQKEDFWQEEQQSIHQYIILAFICKFCCYLLHDIIYLLIYLYLVNSVNLQDSLQPIL